MVYSTRQDKDRPLTKNNDILLLAKVRNSDLKLYNSLPTPNPQDHGTNETHNPSPTPNPAPDGAASGTNSTFDGGANIPGSLGSYMEEPTAYSVTGYASGNGKMWWLY